MAEDYPKLIVVSGPEQNKEFSLKDLDSCKVGRSDTNDFQLVDTSVSRHHASVLKKNGQWFFRDENSRNGSLVRDQDVPVGQDITLNNFDTFRVGAYEIRFVTGDVSEDEIRDKTGYQKKEDAPAQIDSDIQEKSVSRSAHSSNEKKEDDEDADDEVVEGLLKEGSEISNSDTDRNELVGEMASGQPLEVPKTGASLKVFFIITVCFILAGVGLYYHFEQQKGLSDSSQTGVQSDVQPTPQEKLGDQNQKPNQTKTVVEKDESKAVEEKVLKTAAEKKLEEKKLEEKKSPTEETPKENLLVDETKTESQTIPVQTSSASTKKIFQTFLVVRSVPLAAQVYMNGDRLGSTPLRRSLSFEVGKTYTLHVEYELRDINDIYRKTLTFTPKPGSDVIEMDVDADIGVLKVAKLPRHAELYLEGYYDYDKEKAHPVKVSDVIYGKPIYVPFGRYSVELRDKENVSGSTTTSSVIKYQREFLINDKQREVRLAVEDEDLTRFPALIRTDPPGAEVILKNQVLGKTPFEGYLAQGTHELILKKEGYFDTPLVVEMSMNALFETDVALKTSKIGEYINKAKEKVKYGQDEEALGLLVDALKYGGSRREKAEAYLLLGQLYLKGKQPTVGIPYLENAKEHESFYLAALISLAEAEYQAKDSQKALKTIIEALVNMDDHTPHEKRSEANRVFKLVAGTRSVMYLHTSPSGASIFLNDKKQSEVTPAIIFGSDFRSMNIRFEKSGFETFKTKHNLKAGEFVLIRVDLTPVQL